MQCVGFILFSIYTTVDVSALILMTGDKDIQKV